MKWSFNRLKLPFKRNNPNNPQKKRTALPPVETSLLPRHWTDTERNHGSRARAIVPWASTITHKLPLNHFYNATKVRDRKGSSISVSLHSASPSTAHTKSCYDNFRWYTSDANKDFSRLFLHFFFLFSRRDLLPTRSDTVTNNQFLVVTRRLYLSSLLSTNVFCNVVYRSLHVLSISCNFHQSLLCVFLLSHCIVFSLRHQRLVFIALCGSLKQIIILHCIIFVSLLFEVAFAMMLARDIDSTSIREPIRERGKTRAHFSMTSVWSDKETLISVKSA